MQFCWSPISFLAIHSHLFCSKRFFSGEPVPPPVEKLSAFAKKSYNRVSNTRLWHNTARPTLAA